MLADKDKTRLRRLGKNPDRREEDVEDGRPVNTDHVVSEAGS